MKIPESHRPGSKRGEVPDWLIWSFAIYHLLLITIFLLLIYKIKS